MATLEISLLGSFQVRANGQAVTGFKSNKVRALLAYLAVEADRPHRRESLAGLLWPDWPDHAALSNLRYALSNLRTAIGDQEANPPFLSVTRESLLFNRASDVWVDAACFTQVVEANSVRMADLDAMEQAVALYHGNFLEGFFLNDSPAFEEWTLLKRENLARLALSAWR